MTVRKFDAVRVARAVTCVLFMAAAILWIASTTMIFYLSDHGGYVSTREQFQEQHLLELDRHFAEIAVERGTDNLPANFHYVITVGHRGEQLAGNVEDGEETQVDQLMLYAPQSENGVPTRCVVTVYRADQLVGKDIYVAVATITGLCHDLGYYAYLVMGIAGVLGGIFLAIFLYLCGHRRDGSVAPRHFDLIPWDVLLIICALLVLWEFGSLRHLPNAERLPVAAMTYLIMTMVDVLIGTALIASFAVRLKCRMFWRTSLLGKLGIFIAKRLQKRGKQLRESLRSIPVNWPIPLVFVLTSGVEAACLWCGMSTPTVIVLWVAKELAVAIMAFKLNEYFARLYRGGKKLAEGMTEDPISVEGLPGGFRRHAEHLNEARDGIARAVEERTRSERLRTELITNVSHDLKTPLTSMVSCADLIARSESTDADVRQCAEMLSRQAERLRRLIEDLIEASKVTSGALELHPEPCDLDLLLSQAKGEYTGRLEQAGISVVQSGEQGLTVLADGRYLWRVIDNLLSNVQKYAMPGTRLYVIVGQGAGNASLIFRNVTKEPIGVPAGDLMERFVRGDVSRSAEGSGLGLSIAGSLAELMGGSLTLSVEGDVFSAEVRLPLWEE